MTPKQATSVVACNGGHLDPQFLMDVEREKKRTLAATASLSSTSDNTIITADENRNKVRFRSNDAQQTEEKSAHAYQEITTPVTAALITPSPPQHLPLQPQQPLELLRSIEYNTALAAYGLGSNALNMAACLLGDLLACIPVQGRGSEGSVLNPILARLQSFAEERAMLGILPIFFFFFLTRKYLQGASIKTRPKE